MTWEPDPDPVDWLQPWEELVIEDGWPEEYTGPAYAMAWWCMMSTDPAGFLARSAPGDWYRPRARWVSERD